MPNNRCKDSCPDDVFTLYVSFSTKAMSSPALETERASLAEAMSDSVQTAGNAFNRLKLECEPVRRHRTGAPGMSGLTCPRQTRRLLHASNAKSSLSRHVAFDSIPPFV